MTATNDRDGFLARILATPQGQEVLLTFIDTWLTSRGDSQQSWEKSMEVADRHGIRRWIEFGALVELMIFLIRVAPLIPGLIQAIKDWLSRPGQLTIRLRN